MSHRVSDCSFILDALPLARLAPARLRRRSAKLRAPRIGELRSAAAAATVEAWDLENEFGCHNRPDG